MPASAGEMLIIKSHTTTGLNNFLKILPTIFDYYIFYLAGSTKFSCQTHHLSNQS